MDLSARLSHSGALKPRRDHHTLTNEGSDSPEGPVGGDENPSQDGENWLFQGERAPESWRVFNHPAKRPGTNQNLQMGPDHLSLDSAYVEPHF